MFGDDVDQFAVELETELATVEVDGRQAAVEAVDGADGGRQQTEDGARQAADEQVVGPLAVRHQLHVRCRAVRQLIGRSSEQTCNCQ